MDMRAMYTAIKEMQAELRFRIQAHVFLDDASREIKALAATYELQDYLAGLIVLDPEPSWED